MIVYGIGFIMIFRSALTWIMIKITKITDEKIKIQTIISIIESVQQTLLLMMAILLRTHNILYVVGLGFIEMVIEELVPGIISLPVPYLTMVCLWLGRASFFYQVSWYSKGLLITIKQCRSMTVRNSIFITKTRPCNIQRFFTAVKMKFFR